MNRQRIWAVAYKEWREIVRDRLFFTLAFVVPALLMLLFGYGLSLDVEDIPLAIVDYDHSVESRDYAYRFIDSRYFAFQGYVNNEQALGAMLASSHIRAAIIIPPQFGQRLQAGQASTVQTLVDGTFPFRAMTAKGYVTALNAAANQDTLARLLAQAKGVSLTQARQMIQPVKLEVRYLYNQSVKSIWSLAPKLLMVILMISPPFLTALGVVREKESGSIFNIYSATVSRGEFLAGKLAPYVVISSLNILILWLLAVGLFDAPFKGSWLFFMLASLIYVICTTGIGLLVSVAVRTQVAAMIVTAIVTVIPAVLYSGVLIPIPSLGPTAQLIAHLLPAMYYTNIVVGCFLKGVGFSALWPDMLVLAGYATTLFSIGYLMFHKRPNT
ncbi:ABC-2 type transport system permease protein/ribosome-dependent ATPase [Chitinivorax tropicus]|uniref:ABC-2 type transport system permease protein/ribosome-dependent ATPase n=1 Tax=Chitinivorax tropicus TaxID=714531 RepID=A0A840MGX0_9PROT|nr:ABC transporter permease [Chitinivorax tropicus]MBB5016775.1 ABC-2 type transport system permease protein/ribosome-dependent ATPase [Chitinivorax tropicus]